MTDKAGALDEDLDRAIAAALTRKRADAATLGARYSWQSCTGQFAKALTFFPARPAPEPMHGAPGLAA